MGCSKVLELKLAGAIQFNTLFIAAEEGRWVNFCGRNLCQASR